MSNVFQSPFFLARDLEEFSGKNKFHFTNKKVYIYSQALSDLEAGFFHHENSDTFGPMHSLTLFSAKNH